MSAQTVALRGAAKAADDDLGNWLKGLVTGEGNSPSQIVLSGILGVVPGLGQAMDLRDIVLGVILISKSPANPLAWLDIAITLVGCVPVAGDGLKTVFRLVKRGDALPRILDGLSPVLRGNVEKWTRTIDWGALAGTVKRSFDDVMGAFIDGLDSWVVKTVVGRGEVNLLIRQIKDLRGQAPKMLDQAVGELKAMWGKAVGDKLPRSTAASSSPRPSLPITASKTPTAKTSSPPTPSTRKPAEIKTDRSAKATTTPDKPRVDERRAAKKKQDWRTGVPAEHITDYWCAKNKRNLKKANNAGKLWEEWDKAGRPGIDHVWVQSGNPARPGVIAETKSSLFGAFKFLAALTPEIRQQLQQLGDGEIANPTPSGQPNIFKNEGRDAVGSGRVRVEGTTATAEELKKGLGKPNVDTGLRTQMSHGWIRQKLDSEQLTGSGLDLRKKVRAYRKEAASGSDAPPPYARWIVMVTGRQKHQHERAQGHQHQIQQPLISLPDNILIE